MGVYVKSYGMTKLGRSYYKSIYNLVSDALNDMEGLVKPDMIIVSSLFSASSIGQLDLASKVTEISGFTGVPAIRVETGETSGHNSVLIAFRLLAGGMYDNILVIGAEKTTEFIAARMYKEISKVFDSEYEAYMGVGHASLHALAMKEYMKRYDKTHKELAYWPALMHKNAADNPYAALRFPVDQDSVVKANIISEPITLLDSYPLVDGASAVLITRNPNSALAEIKYAYSSTDAMPVTHKEDLLDFPAVRRVYSKIKNENGCDLSIDIYDVTDQFTITPYLMIESIGLAEKGKSVDLANQGFFDRDGDIPMNITGGLKARGHPFGATGIYQVAELSGILSGTFQIQMPEAKEAMILGINGLGSNASGILIGRR
ncbi:MAG: thiolase family protein [Desulfurococcales archaeon]|nr:thiolase family protein [Desulfurococcales archaeon]